VIQRGSSDNKLSGVSARNGWVFAASRYRDSRAATAMNAAFASMVGSFVAHDPLSSA
jgi:hypothetical protein